MKGIVEAVSTKFGCSIKVEDVWYKCADITQEDFEKLNLRGKMVEFIPTDKKQITSLGIVTDKAEPKEEVKDIDSITKAVALKGACSAVNIDPMSSEEVWNTQKERLEDLYELCLRLLK